MIYLRSAIFLVWFLLVSIVIHVVALPTLVMPWRFALGAARMWGNAVLWGLRVFTNLTYEVRGEHAAACRPVLVAAKHFSMWETITLVSLLPRPVFVMKRSLMRLPFYGWFTRRSGMIGIERGGGASELRRMVTEAKRALAQGRPIVIFPEGTRKEPGDPPDYKPGVAGLYGQLDVLCVPVALNSGLYWTAGGLLKRPGTIVVEFLEPIPPGLRPRDFMAQLEDRIETASKRLVAEGRAALHL